MSRASRHLAKEKKKMKQAMGNETINCPECGTPVPQKEFLKKDMGVNYRCKVCGRVVYEEWVKKNLDFSNIKIPAIQNEENMN